MRTWAGPSRTPIGLDIGSSQVKAAQLHRRGNRWALSAAACFPRLHPDRPADADEVARIAAILRRRGFRGNRVVPAVPDAHLLSAAMELPSVADRAALLPIARSEFARVHKRDPSAFEMDFWPLPSSRSARGASVLAVGCAHEDAEALLSLLDLAGLQTIALDAGSLALAAATAPLADTQGVTVVLDLGWSAARLLMIHDGIIAYERVLADSGARRLADQLRQQLSLEQAAIDYLIRDVGLDFQKLSADTQWDRSDDARRVLSGHLDALVHEFNASLAYFAHRYPDIQVRKVLLSGGGAAMPGLAEHLCGVLGLPTQAVAATDVVDVPTNLAEHGSSSGLIRAIGLAQHREDRS